MTETSAAMEERLGALRDASEGAFALMAPWLREGAELEVYRACPVAWARDRGLDADVAADAMLHAASADLVRIGWELVCPGCGFLIDAVDRFTAVPDHFHCAMCEQERDLALDDWIHVTFGVRPEVRSTRYHHREQLSLRELVLYCETGIGVRMASGLPYRDMLARSSPVMEFLDAGATLETSFRASPGVILACPLGHVPVSGDEATTHLALSIDREGKLVGLPDRVAPGPVTIRFENLGDVTRRVMLVQSPDGLAMKPPEGYVASRLLHHPTYARLFPSQLSCGGRLTVRDVTLLFTDVAGSTAMYGKLGDLAAYERIREHFAAIAPIIEAHRGLWVKDVGDAVMASFETPEAAVRAAVDMQAAMRRLGDLELKIGVHGGAAIAVDYRGRLDWFGTTVNLAARVQGLAGPGEICLTESTYERARAVVEGTRAEPFEARCRGIDEPVRVRRIRAEAS